MSGGSRVRPSGSNTTIAGDGLPLGLLVLSFTMTMAIANVTASRGLHASLLNNVLRQPLAFFDTTPTGRITNRCGQDMARIDVDVPFSLREMSICILEVLSSIIVIAIVTPLILAVILPAAVVFWFVQRYFVATTRQLQRLGSAALSPIYSHFNETLQGTTSIRAYRVAERFIAQNERLLDRNTRCRYAKYITWVWMPIRMELLCSLTIFSAIVFTVAAREHLPASAVGLSIVYALLITDAMAWLVLNVSDFETSVVSVERLQEYTALPTEAEWEIAETKPPPSWPGQGQIEFVDYQLRYRPGLDLALNGVTCSIQPGEKVGIVGRTGAGKSSLTLALFRIVEPAGGRILIDGVDISTIGLHDLRGQLSIIPQDPVLFSGSLRMNCDPFGRHSDEAIWRALESAHLKEFVSELDGGLLFQVAEGGENLSVGQRQLLCLSRALLHRSKVLVLDEATAAVDMETDELIQSTIRTEFASCTVLTIAHRLHTVLDANRIMVLDQGRIAEFDRPECLLQQEASVFYGMARDAGVV